VTLAFVIVPIADRRVSNALSYRALRANATMPQRDSCCGLDV